MKKIILTFIISIISAQNAIATCTLGSSRSDRVIKSKIKGNSTGSTVVDGI